MYATLYVYTSGDSGGHGSALTAFNGSSVSSSMASLPGPLQNSELLKTPPKRKTARKRTGRVALHTSGDSCSLSHIEGRSESSRANGGKRPPTKKRKTEQEMGDSCGSESEREKEKLEVGTEQDTELVTRDKSGDKEGERVSETLAKEEAVEEMEVSREEKKDQNVQEQEEEDTTIKVSKKSSNTPGGAEKKPLHPFFSKNVV